MKKIFFALLSFSIQFVSAQPTQAEIDKMMKQAQDAMKKYGNDSTVNKAMKVAKDKQKEVTDAMKNQQGNNNALPVNKNDTAEFSLPSKNNKLLNALPIRTFNRNELISYLHNLYSKLTEYLRTTYKTDINNFALTAIKQSGTPIGLWMKGKVNESVLVTLKAAELQPDNNLKLNNTGGILTSCGLGFYGIPILEYALEKQPDNNMILNNLGQAYLDLGDDKKAEQYLLKCIKTYKYYPDANLALAYIHNSRGNKSAAINYVENALRGAWSSKSENLLEKLKPDVNMMDYVRQRYKQPEFFNFFKYDLLPQCMNVKDIAVLKPQYDAYHNMTYQLRVKYGDLYSEATESYVVSMPKHSESVRGKTDIYRPFGFLGVWVVKALDKEYEEKFRLLEIFKVNYYRERAALNKKFDSESDKIKRDDKIDISEECRQLNALKNAYLPLYAEKTQVLQQKMLAYYKNSLNDYSYWYYISSINDDDFHCKFYMLVIKFLYCMEEINTTRFREDNSGLFYPCEIYNPVRTKALAKELEIEQPDCYLTPKIEINLGAFKLETSCETYKLEAGEGLVGKIEYTRSSGDITLALGVGASVPKVFFKSPGIEAGLEADAKSQGYLTFNRFGKVTDGGILWEAELKAVIGIGNVKESIGLEEGLTAGFGTGVQMKENSQLKQAIDKTFPVQPDDNQQNKNVPLYKKPL